MQRRHGVNEAGTKGVTKKMIIWFGLAVLGFVTWGLPILLKPVPAEAAAAANTVDYSDAVVQVYGADVWGVRGRFAIHTWIATKAPHADNYTIYQVIGWRLRRGISAVSISEGVPNQKWFGSDPILLLDERGYQARELVDKIDQAARLYPFADTYTMWPGPNSNSFIAWIGLKVPELNLALPTKALGKNWMESKFTELQHAPNTAK